VLTWATRKLKYRERLPTKDTQMCYCDSSHSSSWYTRLKLYSKIKDPSEIFIVKGLSYGVMIWCYLTGGDQCFNEHTVTILLYMVSIFVTWYKLTTDTGGRAVCGIGLQPLDCRDGEFESHWGHGCSLLVFVVCCEVATSATDQSFVQRSLCVVFLSVCDLETSA
jgi:hypothetical protein